MSIRKAVFPAAGLGTRFLPATKAQPKEMLPLVDKPLIQFGVEEARASGISEVIIVTGRGKRAIEDHFDMAPELELALAKKGDKAALAEVQRITDLALVLYVRQRQALGLGHAVLVAQPLVGNEPFAVILTDDIIFSNRPALAQLIDVYNERKASVIAVERVAPSALSSYGIIAPKPLGNGLYEVERLVEKPKPQDAPSDLGIVGRYILTPEIFTILQSMTAGRGGEIQLTDALQRLTQEQKVYAYEFEGTRHDAGSKIGFLRATVQYALQTDLAEEFRAYLSSLDL